MSLREAVHRAEEGFIALILGVMCMLTFVQVVLRYGFNTGFVWALEANFYLFSWLVMVGISYCVRVRAHIGVDAVVKLLSPRWRRIVGILALLLALLYTAFMIYGSFEYIHRMYIINVEAEDLPIETWKLSVCLPLGFVLLLVRLLEMGWRIATGQSSGYELADEAHEATKDVTHDQMPDSTTVQR